MEISLKINPVTVTYSMDKSIYKPLHQSALSRQPCSMNLLFNYILEIKYDLPLYIVSLTTIWSSDA